MTEKKSFAFRHAPSMGSLSGEPFGSYFEEVMQDIFESGCNWLHQNEHDDVRFISTRCEHDVEMLRADTDQARELENEAMSACEYATIQMHTIVMYRLLYVAKYGWEKYQRKCESKAKKNEKTVLH